MDRNGLLGIPESAKMVLYMEQRLKQANQDLISLKEMYDGLQKNVKPVLRDLLAHLFEELNQKLRPGFYTLTWSSMNIGDYIQEVREELKRLEQLLISVNDSVENRIEKNLKEIS